MKSHAGFRFVPIPMTLNDLERRNSPYFAPKASSINFGMFGRVLDVINSAKFRLDWFRGFGAIQVAENRYLPWTVGIAVTTVYALTCYIHRDKDWRARRAGSNSSQLPYFLVCFNYFSGRDPDICNCLLVILSDRWFICYFLACFKTSNYTRLKRVRPAFEYIARVTRFPTQKPRGS